MNLRDVGSETSVNDSVQKKKTTKKRLKFQHNDIKKDIKI